MLMSKKISMIIGTRRAYILNNEVTKHYDKNKNDLKCRKKGSDCDLGMMSAVSSTAAKDNNPQIGNTQHIILSAVNRFGGGRSECHLSPFNSSYSRFFLLPHSSLTSYLDNHHCDW